MSTKADTEKRQKLHSKFNQRKVRKLEKEIRIIEQKIRINLLCDIADNSWLDNKIKDIMSEIATIETLDHISYCKIQRFEKSWDKIFVNDSK